MPRSYEDGRRSYEGRDAIVGFPQRRSAIQASSPSTTPPPRDHLLGDDEATGRWYLEDRVIIPEFDIEIAGTRSTRIATCATAAGGVSRHTGYDGSSRSAEPTRPTSLLVHDSILNR